MKKKNKEKNVDTNINKGNKVLNILTKLLYLFDIIAAGFLIYSILLLSGIETKLLIIGVIIIFVCNLLLLIILRKLLKNKTIYKYIIGILIILLSIIVQAFAGYYINKTFSIVHNLNKDSIEYSSSIIVLKDSKLSEIKDLKNKKIGMSSDKTSMDYYVIPNKIKKEKLKDANITSYDDTNEMIDDLLNSEIDAAFVSSDYVSKFSSINGFEDIKEKTKVIYTKKESYTKKQIAKLTGDKTIISNSDAKITEPFTVLLMGVDTTDTYMDKSASGNGDALMLVTFNPKTLNATILSIPRDSYVPISCFGNMENKITHAAWSGESCMINTIQNLTGINIDYYIKINFKGLVNLVDKLGGIEVDVPTDICEQDSNRSFSNLQCMDEGLQTLNGEQALALARHRKTLLTGDLQRGLNQQLVIKGILNKAKTIKSASQAMSLVEEMSVYMDTNFTTNQILSFYDIFKKILLTSSSENIINIDQLYLSGATQSIFDERMRMVLSDYIINQSSLKQDIEAMKMNLGILQPDSKKRINFNIEEQYEKEIIGTNNLSGTKRYDLLPDFTGMSEAEVVAYLNSKGIAYTIAKDKTADPNLDGKSISQSYFPAKRIDLISSPITIVIGVYNKTSNDENITDPNNTFTGENTGNNENTDNTGNNDNTSNNDNTENNSGENGSNNNDNTDSNENNNG